MHYLLVARIKDYPNGNALMRGFEIPSDYEEVKQYGVWTKTDDNIKDCPDYAYFQLHDKNGDIWEKTSGVYDYCILGGRFADKEHPCITTYGEALKSTKEDVYCYAVMENFECKSADYPEKENLWNYDDLVYILDTHK